MQLRLYVVQLPTPLLRSYHNNIYSALLLVLFGVSIINTCRARRYSLACWVRETKARAGGTKQRTRMESREERGGDLWVGRQTWCENCQVGALLDV